MSILDEAKEIVHGDRRDAYGDPQADFERTALMWGAILGCDVTPEQVVLCMVAIKLSRLCHRVSRDSLVDVAGYAEVLAMLVEKRAIRPRGPGFEYCEICRAKPGASRLCEDCLRLQSEYYARYSS